MWWLVGVYVVAVILAMIVGCALMRSHAPVTPKTTRLVRYLTRRKVELWSAFIAILALIWCVFIHMVKHWLHL